MDNPEWKRWIDQARDDYEYGCSGVMEHPRGATWNFHQAAEKAIKSLLLRCQVEFPRTHDLARLLAFLPQDKQAGAEIREFAFLLSSYFPITRYPGDFPEINSGRAREAMEASNHLLGWVEQILRSFE